MASSVKNALKWSATALRDRVRATAVILATAQLASCGGGTTARIDTKSSASGTCTSPECEIPFDGTVNLADGMLVDGVLKISEAMRTDDAVRIANPSALTVRGYSIVSSSSTCVSAEPITALIPPAVKDLAARGEGSWNVCVAILANGRRILLRSPQVTVDLSAPSFSAAPSLTGNHSLSPTVSWPIASDNVTTIDELNYEVWISESAVSTIQEARTTGERKASSTGLSSLQISGLVANRTYYVTIIAEDRAGNAVMTEQVEIDTRPASVPVVSISGPDKDTVNSGDTITWTVSYSLADAVALDGKASIVATGDATATVTSVNCATADTCTVTATAGSGDGTIKLSVAANSATNFLGGAAAQIATTTTQLDNTGPSVPQIQLDGSEFDAAMPVAISQGTTPADDFKEFRYTVGASPADPTCGTGVALAGAPTNAMIPGGSDQTLKVIACDEVGNASSVSTETYTWDAVPPQLQFSAPDENLTVSGPVVYTLTVSDTRSFTFDPAGKLSLETVSGTVTGGNIAVGGSHPSYTLTVTGFSGDGEVRISAAPGVATDTAGNSSLSSNSGNFTVFSSIPPPIADDASRSFNTAFSTNLSTGTSIGSAFRDFRYTLNSVEALTCATGTTANDSTNISIPAATTTLRAVTCTKGGNASAITTVVYTYDNTPPTVSISSPSSAFANATATVDYSVTYAGASTITLDAADITVTASGGANAQIESVSLSTTNIYTVRLHNFSGNGSVGIEVDAATASDSVGNTAIGASSTTSITVDTTPPAAPALDPSSLTFNGNATVTVAQNATTDVNFLEFRYTTTGTPPEDCAAGLASDPGPINILAATTSLTLTAVACDAAGNPSSPATATLTYDITPPGAPGVSSSSIVTNVTSVTWNWSTGGGGNGTYRYRLDSSDLTTGATTTTGLSLTLENLADGPHTLYVQERDDAGNWSSSGSYEVTIDLSAPGAPSVSSAAATVNGTSVTWTWSTGGDGNGTYRYRLDNSDLSTDATLVTDPPLEYPATNLSEGAHTLYVQERDAAGNWSASGSYQVTVDLTPPDAPSVSSASALVNSDSVTWTWSTGGGGNGTYRYQLNNSDLSSEATQISATTLTLENLTEASQTLYVQERDAAGNWSASGSYAVTVDLTAPGMPVVSADAQDYLLGELATWTWTSGGGGNGYRYKLDDNDFSSGSQTTANASFSTSDLAAGEHTLYVQERDAAGNWSVAGSDSLTVKERVATPTLDPAGGDFANQVSVTITTATPGASIYYTTDGTTPNSGSTPYSNSPVSISTDMTLKAIAVKDGWADSSVVSAAYNFKVATPAETISQPLAFLSTFSLSLSTGTTGASIYYTTDGETPTVASILYAGPISLSETTTIKAIAIKTGYDNSEVFVKTYTRWNDVTTTAGGVASNCSTTPGRCTYENSTNGYEWTYEAGTVANFADANAHCDNLAWNGKSNWRLPTIAELGYARTGGLGPLVMSFTGDNAGGTAWSSTSSTPGSRDMVDFEANGTGSTTTLAEESTAGILCIHGPLPQVNITGPGPASIVPGSASTATFDLEFVDYTELSIATSNISLVTTGGASASVVSVTGTGSTRVVTIGSFGSGEGTVGITVAMEVAGNFWGDSVATTSTSTIDVAHVTTDVTAAGSCAEDPDNCSFQQSATGLSFTQYQTLAGFEQAMDHCWDLTYNGFDDWRIPTQGELSAAFDAGLASLTMPGTDWGSGILSTPWITATAEGGDYRGVNPGNYNSLTCPVTGNGTGCKVICVRSETAPTVIISQASLPFAEGEGFPSQTISWDVEFVSASDIPFSDAVSAMDVSPWITIVTDGTADAQVTSVTRNYNKFTVTLGSFTGSGSVTLRINSGGALSGTTPSVDTDSDVVDVNPGTWTDATTAGGSGIASCSGSPENCSMLQASTGIFFSIQQADASATNATGSCDALEHNGETDWRVPTLTELQSARAEGIYALSMAGMDWSSQPFVTQTSIGPGQYQVLNISTGVVTTDSGETDFSLLCVRGPD